MSYNGDLDVTKFKKKDGLIGDRITGICTDMDNVVWYACDKGGIGNIFGNQLQSFPFPELNVRHLVYTGEDFLAATPEGIFRFSPEGKITHTYTAMNNEISSDNVYVLIPVGKDTLFAGQHNGADMIVFNKNKPVYVKHIRESGFLGMEAVVRYRARIILTEASGWEP